MKLSNFNRKGPGCGLWIMSAILISILIIITGFTIVNPAANQAEVNQVQGILIFTDSKPMQNYEYLGSVKAFRISGSDQYQPVRDYLIKKVKENYPAANGAVFHFNNGSADYADAIKLNQ